MDQGAPRSRPSPRARLITGLIVTVSGAILAVAGIASTWYTVSVPGRTVEIPDVGRASLLGESFPHAGSDVAGGAAILVVVALLAAGTALLAGGRVRGVLLAAVVLAAVGSIGVAATVTAEDARAATPERVSSTEPDVATGIGKGLTIAGAVTAAVGAAASLPLARRVARVRMPEGVPGSMPEDEA